ncbi:MAG: thioredoxin domain-containing protein [Candidatus Sumerlaeaceae bacterium]
MSKAFSLLRGIMVVGVIAAFLLGCQQSKKEFPEALETPLAKSSEGTSPTSEQRTLAVEPQTTGVEAKDQTTSPAEEALTTVPEASPASKITTPVVQYRDENCLADEASPYLRSLTSAPVHWHPWAKEAFEAARQLDRPVIVALGASWSLESRALDEETFNDPQVADFLNTHFVPLKVDVDERPEVAQRYELFHAILRGDAARGSLVIAALPDGAPFEATSYLPARAETSGATGMLDFLKAVEQVYRSSKDRAVAQAKRFEQLVSEARAQLLQTSPTAEINKEDAARRTAEIIHRAGADLKKDGALRETAPWGRMVLLALHHYSDTGSSVSLAVAEQILDALATSPLKDPILGGYFHRLDASGFALDGKLLPDQAIMLRAYCWAYAATGKSSYREEAEHVLSFMRDTFEDQHGGFYSSQQPDANPHAPEAYFTWSAAEIMEALDKPLEREVVLRLYGLDSGNRTEKRMLRRSQALSEVATALNIKAATAQKALTSATQFLRAKRYERDDFPLVNKARVVSWNASMVCAYADAWRYLGDKQGRDFAIKTVSELLDQATTNTGIVHYLGRGQTPDRSWVLLEDQVAMAEALLDCAEISGNHALIQAAEELMERVHAQYAASGRAIYYDGEQGTAAELWHLPLIPVQDALIDSPNATAARVWFQLYRLTGQNKFMARSTECVGLVYRQGEWWDEKLSSYGRSLLTVAFGPPKAIIVGAIGQKDTLELWRTALGTFRVGKCVEVLAPEAAAKTDYLPSKDGKAVGYVCTAEACAPPAKDAKKLRTTLFEFGRE